MAPLTDRFDRALEFASELHARDVRKGGEVPYVSHLLGVASLVLEDGGSEDEAIAALLHDAAEDHGHEQLDRIRKEFGEPVAEIVAACTDTLVAGKEDWEERKRAYLAHLREHRDSPALRVALADKLYNARAILRDYRAHGDALWARFRRGVDQQLWYYRGLASAFHEVRPGAMASELVDTVTELGRLVAEAETRPGAPDADTRPDETHVVAVDWSGRQKGAEETIWLAEARDGFLVRLENGRGREELIEHVEQMAARHRRLVVGFDFAFSFPEWFAREQLGARDGHDVWAAVAERADRWLEQATGPFWGLGGVRQPPGTPERRHRATELVGGGRAPKSVFQIAGAGHVGTGSLRGMPFLKRLAEHGFSIWPFDEPGWPRVVEIYPALLTPPGVTKSRRDDRVEALAGEPFVPPVLRERAASSEDAFDAAISALAMSRHVGELEALRRGEGVELIEGAIWRPRVAAA